MPVGVCVLFGVCVWSVWGVCGRRVWFSLFTLSYVWRVCDFLFLVFPRLSDFGGCKSFGARLLRVLGLPGFGLDLGIFVDADLRSKPEKDV